MLNGSSAAANGSGLDWVEAPTGKGDETGTACAGALKGSNASLDCLEAGDAAFSFSLETDLVFSKLGNG